MSASTHVDDVIAMFALGALEEEERGAVERHLQECGRCRLLAEEALESVGYLPLAVDAVTPAPAVKAALFARVDSDLKREERVAKSAAPPRESVIDSLHRALRAWSPALALASLLLVVYLGGRVLSLQSEVEQRREEIALLSAPNLQTAELPAAGAAPEGAQARLFLAPDRSTALLTVSALEPLDAARTYEFWLIRGDEPVPAGLFEVDAEGNGRLLVESSAALESFDQAGITIEPAGGSETPNFDALVFAGPIR